MKRITSLLLCVFTSYGLFGQEYQGRLSAVPKSGLYQIVLSPALRSYTKDDVNKIRIYDARQNEVPYLVFKPHTSTAHFENFPILATLVVPKVSTTVIVSNKHADSIDRLILRIANTDVRKMYSISGSNDSLAWFGLVNNQTVGGLSAPTSTSIEHIFNFPLNNYKYLKFDFIDKNSLPINVLNVGLVKTYSHVDSAIYLSDFTQRNLTDTKTKQTKIAISFPSPQVIDGIQFDISAPNHYYRDAHIVVDRVRVVKKKEVKYQAKVSSFGLRDKTNNSFRIDPLFLSHFTLVIENRDNPALTIDKISFLQDPLPILVDLRANESYTLVVDANFPNPDYDLKDAAINLNQEYPRTTVLDLKPIAANKNTVAYLKYFWLTSAFMWICIIVGVLVLGYFAAAMVKDMNKQKD